MVTRCFAVDSLIQTNWTINFGVYFVLTLNDILWGGKLRNFFLLVHDDPFFVGSDYLSGLVRIVRFLIRRPWIFIVGGCPGCLSHLTVCENALQTPGTVFTTKCNFVFAATDNYQEDDKHQSWAKNGPDDEPDETLIFLFFGVVFEALVPGADRKNRVIRVVTAFLGALLLTEFLDFLLDAFGDSVCFVILFFGFGLVLETFF